MIRVPAMDRHLDDAELVRHIDDEGSAQERLRRDHHLASCARCRGQADELRAQSRAIRSWLEQADFPRHGSLASGPASSPAPGLQLATAAGARTDHRAPAAGRPAATTATAPWLKAAAVVLLMAAPVVALPAAREWVGERLPSLRSGPTPAGAPEGAVARDAGATAIRFEAAPGIFQVSVRSPQEQGSLTIGRGEPGTTAILELGAGGARPEAEVSSRRIRIDNDPAATASYILLLPASVTAVVVEVAGRRVDLAGRDLDSPVALGLDR